MTSLHYITHAVSLAVIASLARKYLHIKYAYEDLEERCRYQSRKDIPEYHDDKPHSLPQQQSDNNINSKGKMSSKLIDEVSTSLWCSGQNRSDRICKFENLCYNTVKDDFVFLLGADSVIEGVDPHGIHNALLDMTSVEGHNIHFMAMTRLPSKALRDFSVYWFHGPTLLFNRFKPDNIMHVLHDDIFPLHYTLEMIHFGANFSKPPYDIQLIFFEGWDIGEFSLLYSHFTLRDLKTKEQLETVGEMVCFRHGHVGISKTTTWYQYGFDKPQSPLDQSEVTSHHIRRTVNYLLSVSPYEKCQICETGEYLVLVSRKENRRILNELELSGALTQQTKLKVVVIGFETHSVSEMMRIVHHSKGVVGMHGSLMILSTFLKPGSVIIELFPFAINPNNYTPFRSLATIKGMNLIYRSWANQNRDNTVVHPDWPTELGGIHDLSKEEQSSIVDQSEVPLHLCCDDPSWLFHIYQDTKVDILAVTQLFIESQTEGSNLQEIPKTPLLQGPVKHVTCDVTTSKDVTLSWERPWNVKYIDYKKVEYEIWLQNTESESTLSLIVGDSSSHVITNYVTVGLTYNIWIRCILDNETQGPFSKAITCQI